MVQALAEVPEAQAEGKIKTVYDDVRATLRLPAVPPLFLSLATYPNYLVTAWTALKPNAQTVFFERSADTIRRAGAEGAGTLGNAPAAGGNAEALLRTLLYTEPKVFLTAAALRTATNGAQPAMLYLSADEKRQIAAGGPEEMAPVTYGDPSESDEAGQALLGEIQDATGLRSIGAEFRGLLANPEYARSAWTAMRSVVDSAQYRTLGRTVRHLAESSVSALPFRMDLAPHALRHAGLRETEIDGVRDLLALQYELAARSVLNVAFLAAGALGTQAASESPFPASVL